MTSDSETADVDASAADSTEVITDVEDSALIETASDQDSTFATALGLTQPLGETPKRRLGRRRQSGFPDPTGRPLVTAASASSAAQSARVVPGLGESAPAPTNPVAARVHAPPTASQPVIPQPGPAPVVGVTPVAVMPEKVSWLQKRRMRARRVRRTIRHIDPWSVFKISILLYACLYIATMAAGVLLWNAAVGSGIIDRFEGFMQDLGFETWELVGDEIFRGASIIGIVLVAAGSALNVVMAILFNLISDLTGGVRVTVIEEDLGRRARS